MTFNPDGWERERGDMPEEGNYFIKILKVEECESKKGNQQLKLDYSLCDAEGDNLGYLDVRFEYITSPKNYMTAAEYKEMKARSKKKALTADEEVKFKLQREEIRKFFWRVEQFEKAFELKRPYEAESLIGKIARAEIYLEPDSKGLLRVKVKAYSNPAEFAAANEAQSFGGIKDEDVTGIEQETVVPEVAPEPAPAPEPEPTEDIWT